MKMKKIANSSYWQAREKAEKAYQKEQLKDVNAFNQKIASMYNAALVDIQKDITFDLEQIDKAGGLAERKALLHKLNSIDKQASEWQKLVNLQKKDFSKEMKKRVKLLKFSMELGRNEFLKADVGARLTQLGLDHQKALTSKLLSDYDKETYRQMGILNGTAKEDLFRKADTMKRLYAQIGGADFSDRIWAHIDQLKAGLDGIIASELIGGKNPRDVAEKLNKYVKDSFQNADYASERIARTETARIQYVAAVNAIKGYGYEYARWYAEPVACRICSGIATYDDGYGRGVYPLKDLPEICVHPNCRCSVGAYWVDKK